MILRVAKEWGRDHEPHDRDVHVRNLVRAECDYLRLPPDMIPHPIVFGLLGNDPDGAHSATLDALVKRVDLENAPLTKKTVGDRVQFVRVLRSINIDDRTTNISPSELLDLGGIYAAAVF